MADLSLTLFLIGIILVDDAGRVYIIHNDQYTQLVSHEPRIWNNFPKGREQFCRAYRMHRNEITMEWEWAKSFTPAIFGMYENIL